MWATGNPAMHRAPAFTPESGFTLIEALVVLGVVGLITALVFPDLSRALDALHARQARTMLHDALLAARAQAMRSGTGATLAVDTGGTALIEPDGHRLPLPAQVSVKATPGTVRFYPDGSASGARFDLITPAGSGVYLVDPGLGLITVAGAAHG